MEMLAIVTIIALIVSLWGLGYTFVSAKNNLGRHEEWHAKKTREINKKIQTLKDKQSHYQADIKKLRSA